jgi:IS5 family transposase
MSQFGFFDISSRLESLSSCGDPLLKLKELVPWDSFRPLIEQARLDPTKQATGRPAYDAVLMFKILILQSLYNLSDDQTEYQIRDRLSFMRFLNLTLADRVPDAKTTWLFKDTLAKKGVVEILFEHFSAHLTHSGYIAQGGQIVDASLISCPKQRNKRAENEAIKEGKIPEDWADNPAKLAQKDVDARWTKKNGLSYYGYKNHINVDKAHKIIRQYDVTKASTHDSQALEAVLDSGNTADVIWADSAYRSQKIEALLAEKKIRSQIHYKGTRGKKLSEFKDKVNHKRSKIRCRVEHIFGAQSQMGPTISRSIGLVRTKARIGLRNLTYNLRRFIFLEVKSTSFSSA